MTVAILLAGGSGIRMGANIPKQFLSVAGREIWVHTALVFQRSVKIDSIVIACHPEYVAVMQSCLDTYGLFKVSHVVAGGEARHDSAYHALQACECNAQDKILVCDIVRPCISQSVIERVVDSLDRFEACDTGVPVKETLFEVRDGLIVDFPDRRRYVSGQGPEGFHFASLHAAMHAYMSGIQPPVTNISSIMKNYLPSLSIGLVEGSDTNIKITTPQDLQWAEWYLSRKNE